MKRSSDLAVSLPARVVLSVILLVVLTVLLVGLPAIMQIQAELNRQSAARAESGAQVAALLLEAERARLEQAALLASSRPTLLSLIENPSLEKTSMAAYLKTLQQGASVDALVICSPQHTLFAAAGDPVPDENRICQNARQASFVWDSQEEMVWLAAIQDVDTQILGSGRWQTLTLRRLDETFADFLSRQAGMDIILQANNLLVASSLNISKTSLSALIPGENFLTIPDKADSGSHRYRIARQESGVPDLSVTAALDLSEFENTSRELTNRILLGMAAASLTGSVLGMWAAGSLTRPLENLRRSAEGLRHGDLFTPVRTTSPLREIQQVSFALEEARAALQHSLSQLQQEKDWNAHLLDSIVEGIITIDRAQRITFFSPGASRITGLVEKKVLGKQLAEVITAPGLAELLHQAGIGGQEQGKLTHIPYQRGGDRQVERTLSVSTAPLHTVEGGGKVVVLRDVTENERLHRLTGDFLANITHEFRTPLAALAAATDLLIDQAVEEPVSSDINNMLSNLRLSIVNLQMLTDNLLEGANMESGRFEISPRATELDEILEPAAAIMRPLIEKYGQRLTIENAVEPQTTVLVDPVRTRQALTNLLSNAARFGPDQGVVMIKADLDTDRRFVRIFVKDQGPGLPVGTAASERLFQRFAHLANTGGRSEAGAGIGLSVVKAIIETQGGLVGAENDPDGGAAFWFTLLVSSEEKDEDSGSG